METRVFCDERLRRLGRWLRAAGYDTRIADAGMADGELMRLAFAEGRLVLSRDRKLLEHNGADLGAIHLQASDTEGCALELCRRVSVNWFYRPFSRCLLCNTPWRPAVAADWPDLPESIRAAGMPLWCCPTWRKVYWQGSHTDRMRAQLGRWQTRCRKGVPTGPAPLPPEGCEGRSGRGT